ncbi:MAG: cytochrome b [Gallionella sp.]
MDLVMHKNDMQIQQQTGYGAIAKLLHWGMALLVISALLAIEFRELFPKGPIRHGVVDWHFQTGLCVLFLIFVRIAWRVKNPIPDISPPLPGMQKMLATIAHFSLYALMMILPILGILAKQSRGDDVDFFGHILPALIDEDSGLPYARTIKAVHTYMGNVFIWLIVAHVLMAFFHHLVRRDNTLIRMLPE